MYSPDLPLPCQTHHTRSGTQNHHHLDKNTPCRGMAWHDHAISLSAHLSPVPPCHSHSTHSPESNGHQPRSFCASDAPENVTPRHAQDVPMHARARTASVADASGHVVARAPPLTPPAPLCAKRSTTPPCAAQTTPLDRGNAVADAHLADVRRGYCRSRHAYEPISPSFSMPSSAASPPGRRLQACVIACPSSSL